MSLHVNVISASGLPRGFPKPDKHSVRALWANSTRETKKQTNTEGPNPEWESYTLTFPAVDVSEVSEEILTLQVIGNNKDKIKCELKIRRAEIGFDRLAPQVCRQHWYHIERSPQFWPDHPRRLSAPNPPAIHPFARLPYFNTRLHRGTACRASNFSRAPVF